MKLEQCRGMREIVEGRYGVKWVSAILVKKDHLQDASMVFGKHATMTKTMPALKTSKERHLL